MVTGSFIPSEGGSMRRTSLITVAVLAGASIAPASPAVAANDTLDCEATVDVRYSDPGGGYGWVAYVDVRTKGKAYGTAQFYVDLFDEPDSGVLLDGYAADYVDKSGYVQFRSYLHQPGDYSVTVTVAKGKKSEACSASWSLPAT